VSFFVTRQGEFVVNKLAPGPTTAITSERGCVTSQFEQMVVLSANLPLGSTGLITPAAIVNLLAKSGSMANQTLQPRLLCPACACTSMRNTCTPAERWDICLDGIDCRGSTGAGP